jgi:excisionase family DNA binding protein
MKEAFGSRPTTTTDPAVLAAVDQLVVLILAVIRAEAAPVAPARERLHDLRAAAAILGVGRTFLYHEIAAGELRTLKCGRRRLCSDSSLREYIAHRQETAGAPIAATDQAPRGLQR